MTLITNQTLINYPPQQTTSNLQQLPPTAPNHVHPPNPTLARSQPIVQGKLILTGLDIFKQTMGAKTEFHEIRIHVCIFYKLSGNINYFINFLWFFLRFFLIRILDGPIIWFYMTFYVFKIIFNLNYF